MPETVPVKDLDSLLQQTLGPDLKVQNSIWKPLTAPGENYGSLIYSVDASVERNKEIESLHLVVKLPPPSAYLLDLFNSPLCFRKELVYYRDIVPVFTELQFETNIEDNKIIRLMPQYYGGRLGSEDPNVFDNQAAIVMENLISVGYYVRDRLLGLDLDHTELVIEGLAKLHAIVIALKIRKPDFFRETVIPALVHTANETAMEAVRGMLKEAHDVYKQLPEAKPFLDRIDRTLKYDYETDWRTFKSTEPWGTMVHNDFWSNNVLFKYSEKGLVFVSIWECVLDSLQKETSNLFMCLLMCGVQAAT
ncbi:uncharacterized protein LOC105690572 isoform X2 [Athalia rosae]|uniref:uncharacterized protein LOC105690572 isoform X2 n=1 Tax=Athalia rosae TaxID=37344 RepID=UPI0020343D80|nr:uncharacterized protein LOC105690572 isoform X2 [Athalia rosae]